MPSDLTDRQSEIYGFIRHRIQTGNAPTVREIGQRFSIRGPNGVVCHLKALERKGYIFRDATVSRGIRLVDAPVCPHCGKAAGEPVEVPNG